MQVWEGAAYEGLHRIVMRWEPLCDISKAPWALDSSFCKTNLFHWTYCISCTTTVCTRLTDTHLIWPCRAAQYHISFSEGRCGTQHVNSHCAALCYIQSFAAECVRIQPQGMHDNCLNNKLRITLSICNSKLICNKLWKRSSSYFAVIT